MKVKHFAWMFCLVSGSALAQVYDVAIEIMDNDKVIATPRLIVEEGKTASVSVSDVFDLSMTVRKQDSAYAVITELKIAEESISPSLLMKPNEPASVMVGDTGLRLTITEQD
tara:strand:- start:703 stop:1038 length:336 start_codon:yes stop_codon:yes gene_type:complete